MGGGALAYRAPSGSIADPWPARTLLVAFIVSSAVGVQPRTALVAGAHSRVGVHLQPPGGQPFGSIFTPSPAVTFVLAFIFRSWLDSCLPLGSTVDPWSGGGPKWPSPCR
jgi:hypothetical protein